MIPILYEAGEKTFTSLGLGKLADAGACTVVEERNGILELTMTYPITGVLYGELEHDRIILAKPNETDRDQPFRIYKTTKPIAGVVTVYGEHVSYQLNSIPVSPFSAASAPEAVAGMGTNSAIDNPFRLATDKTTVANFKVSAPMAFRSLMGGMQGSLLDIYGGEYQYDHWNVFLRNERGSDNGVVIQYGKNLTDVKQDEIISGLLTGVYPFWRSEEDYLELPEKVVAIRTGYAYPRVAPLDLSMEFEEKPTIEQLRAKATGYVEANALDVPRVSMTVSFVQLWQTENYKSHPLYSQLAGLERISLCDTVRVRYLALGIDAKAKVVKTKYDVLRERYDSIDIGEPRTNLSSRTVQQGQALSEKSSYSELERAVQNATNAITGSAGGYVVLDPPNNPERILIMNMPNKNTATQVWQWNKAGLGYSSRGINGPYSTAITAAGEIVADFITTGILTASIIKAGVLASLNGVTSLDLQTGELTFENDTGRKMVLSKTGLTFWHGDEHMGSFYVSAANDGIVKASQILISENDTRLGGLWASGGKVICEVDNIAAGKIQVDGKIDVKDVDTPRLQGRSIVVRQMADSGGTLRSVVTLD